MAKFLKNQQMFGLACLEHPLLHGIRPEEMFARDVEILLGVNHDQDDVLVVRTPANL